MEHQPEATETGSAAGWSAGMSLAEQVLAAAEEAVQQSGFIYQEETGLYYDNATQLYYNSETGLYYNGFTGTWCVPYSASFQFQPKTPL